MKPIIQYSIIVILLLQSTMSTGQDSAVIRSIHFQPGYIQIKDALNYGLVHHGVDYSFRYEFRNENELSVTEYSSESALGLNYRKGAGALLRLCPVKIYKG